MLDSDARWGVADVVDNEAAIACYAGVGFRTVGVMRSYERQADGSWADGLLMVHTRDPHAARQVAEVVLAEVAKEWRFHDPPRGRNGVWTLEAAVRLKKKSSPVDLLGELEDRWSPTVVAAPCWRAPGLGCGLSPRPYQGGDRMTVSALLDAACDLASGVTTVLRAGGVGSESDLPFAGLDQLLRPILDRLDRRARRDPAVERDLDRVVRRRRNRRWNPCRAPG